MPVLEDMPNCTQNLLPRQQSRDMIYEKWGILIRQLNFKLCINFAHGFQLSSLFCRQTIEASQSLDYVTSVDLWSDTIAMDLSISTHPSLVQLWGATLFPECAISYGN